MMFLLGLVLVCSGIPIGWYLREFRRQMQNAVEEAREEKEKDTRKVMHVVISEHDGMYQVHEKGTNKFLAQGKTHKELTEALNDRFENTKFMASPENLDEHGYDE